MSKQVVIFNDYDSGIKFYLVPESIDLTKYDDVLINCYYEDAKKDKLSDELNDIFYGEDGTPNFDEIDRDKFVDLVRDGYSVVMCGMLP